MRPPRGLLAHVLRGEADYQLNLKNEVTLQRLSERVDRLAALVAERMPHEMSERRE